MTWALGQHPNLFPLEETHFIYRLAIDLDHLYAASAAPGLRSFIGSSQITLREFRAHFGNACSDLIESSRERTIIHARSERFADKRTPNITLNFSKDHPKQRWVDGTPENAHYVLPLLRLFPEARFIHVLRNPRQVATSLMHFSSAGGQDYAEDEAFHRWSHMVHACALAEEALGPKHVLRLNYQDIVDDPKTALNRCLSFVGEEFDPVCLLPLRQKINSSVYEAGGDDSIAAHIRSPKPWAREAFELYRDLLAGRQLTSGRFEAFRVLRRNVQECQCRAHPNEQGHAQGSPDTSSTHPKPTVHGLRILHWGPRDIVAGEAFNVQSNGANALWVRTRGAPPDTIIEANGRPLESSVQGNGELVAALVPAQLTSKPGRLVLVLRSASTGEIAGPLICEPLPSGATIRRWIHRAEDRLASALYTRPLSGFLRFPVQSSIVDHVHHQRPHPPQSSR